MPNSGASVQLHAIQEMWDLFPVAGDILSDEEHQSGGSDQVVLAILVAAIKGQTSPKTLALQGTIQDHLVVILIDLGRSHTFISSIIATSLTGLSSLPTPVSVQVANGARMTCTSHFPTIQWQAQQYFFSSDMRVIPLSHYDVFVCMD